MDDNRMRELVQQAVARRCEPLAPDPFLAARVQHAAEQKGEPRMKKKLSAGLVVCIVLIVMSLTALAAVLLTGMEIIDLTAIPLAQGNDGAVRVNRDYTHEELMAVLNAAAENGIIVEDAYILEAVALGEGYDEEETIMAICRVAFGGLIDEWTVEERFWFGEKMVEIGFDDENPYRLPGEGQIQPEEARALAVTLLESEFGSLPLMDSACYRTKERFDEDGWNTAYYPRNLTAPMYRIFISHDRSTVESACIPQSWETYTETQLMSGIDNTYGYRTATQASWSPEAWYTFGQMLPGALRSEAWNTEYDGYLASTYLLPAEGDITEKEACAIAEADAAQAVRLTAHGLLLGRGEERIWKVTLLMLDENSERVTRSWEIDAATGEIQHRMLHDTSTPYWARYMLWETFEAVNSTIFTREAALALAVPVLQEYLDDPTLPFDDPAVYEPFFRGSADGTYYTINLNPTAAAGMEYGRCAVQVRNTGEVRILYAEGRGLTPDNLLSRMDDAYGSSLRWDQSVWVEFDRLMAGLGEPATFEGRLLAATRHPQASEVKLSLDDALDVVALDLGTRSEDAVSWVLIDTEPNPVWKIRMGTYPANTLYEVDAMTGEILDRELYVCQNPDFDHDMKMFTLRSVYMPAALAEFGPVRIAMELTVKSDFDAFSYDETVFMNENCYQVTVDGMTVTFTSIDENLPSYRTTILDNGMDAEIEVFDIPEPRPESEGSPYGNG
ncbi:MAG: PepSY domain-containing protein [Clostridia bacterium]|nr:PepSY domain-containing protein [Clostridia bacterium]